MRHELSKACAIRASDSEPQSLRKESRANHDGKFCANPNNPKHLSPTFFMPRTDNDTVNADVRSPGTHHNHSEVESETEPEDDELLLLLLGTSGTAATGSSPDALAKSASVISSPSRQARPSEVAELPDDSDSESVGEDDDDLEQDGDATPDLPPEAATDDAGLTGAAPSADPRASEG